MMCERIEIIFKLSLHVWRNYCSHFTLDIFLFNLFSNALEIEVGGGRKISEFSTVRMMYTIGIKVNYSLKLSEPSYS